MTVTLRDARDRAPDQDWIRSVYRDYLSELSAAKSGIFPALGEWPNREEEFLAAWFSDAGAFPFLILADGVRAGFALVARVPSFPRRGADHRVAEFFVVKDARRRGVGAAAASLLFSRFSGEWEVLEDEQNRSAIAFWRRAIGVHTRGRFVETRAGGEVCHRFRTTQRAADFATGGGAEV